MRFMFGEGGWSYLERMAYRGFIGFCYDTTLEGVLTYIICGLTVIFAIIGVIGIFKALFGSKKRGKSEYERWERERKKAEKRTGSKL